MVIMLGVAVTLIRCGVIVEGDVFSNHKILEAERKLTQLRKPAVKTIQSEDGDIIDCIDIYKQPAFDHPALSNHTIQMAPTYDPERERKTVTKMDRLKKKNEEQSSRMVKQKWRKSGSCPPGTIPKAILLTVGYRYTGGKGDIKVYNPMVDLDDDYSTSQVSLLNSREMVESGWAVNPSVYGDRETRFFVYWTADDSKKTGCFDLTCAGFVQVSNKVALGAAIYPVSFPHDLPYEIIVYVFKDPVTSNWWVQYGESIYVGYWPPQLFLALNYHATSVEWGGEVYSPRVGTTPHTETDMGSGQFADFVWGTSGSVKRIRIHDNSPELKLPEYADVYMDEFNCYDVKYLVDYVEEPEFYYGGPGRNPMCP
ncbi:protein neprosin-like [Pyrus communis]|uniref:protein neprosin-like n=1 Tax=Pyrus communis TaxID=23211 RepID=UPI0035C1730D